MQPIPPQIAAITRPIDQLWTYYVFKGLMTLFASPIMLRVLYFRFHTMKYEFSEQGIRMSWGILFRNEIVLNYARIQDINLNSNFIERMLGLASINIQTASGSSTSVMTLEGMPDPEGMRDFLYSRMRGAAGHTAAEPAAPADSLAATLQAVTVELRAIREALEKRA